LGRWYYALGTDRYGHCPAFRDMEKPHSRVHALGRDIAKAMARGDCNGALACFAAMQTESRELFRLLDELAHESRNTAVRAGASP
jgi:hypothetical protein